MSTPRPRSSAAATALMPHHHRVSLIVATMLLLLPSCCRAFLVLPRRAAHATSFARLLHPAAAAGAPARQLHRQTPAAIALAGLRVAGGGSCGSSSSSGVQALHSTAPGAAGADGVSSASASSSSGAAATAPTAPTAAGETKKAPQQQQQQQPPKKQQQQQPKPKPKPARPPRGTNLLIVGLGNPGKEYAFTRHNAGFLVVDELARRLGADLKLRSAFQGEYGSATYKGKSVGLLKPTTYMNNSGQSLRKVLDYFKLPFSSVLIVVDEVALELGQIRLRQTGSPGGHNGLKSVEGHLKTKDYHRLRVGVGGAAPGKMVDHVLGEFSRSEKKLLEEVLYDSCDAVEHWIEEDDTDKVMNRVNAPK